MVLHSGARQLTDLENGGLNPFGVNVLRTFPIFGNVVWGARTLEGADQPAATASCPCAGRAWSVPLRDRARPSP